MCNGSTKSGCPQANDVCRPHREVGVGLSGSLHIPPEQISALLEARQQELESGAAIEALDQAQHRLSQGETERGRRLSQHFKGYITDQELDLALREINERLEYQQGELSRLEAEVNHTTEAIDQLQNEMDAYRSIVGRLDSLTDAERAEVVSLVVDRVTVVGREFQIRMVLDSMGYATSSPNR